MTTATLDGKILERRLVTKESTIGGASIFRIAKSLREYNSAIEQDEATEDQIQTAHEAFSRDVLLYRLEMSKLSKAFLLCDDEISNYNIQEGNIEKKIESSRSTILALENELKIEKNIRSFTEKCETKALVVNDLPTPNNLKRQIEECDSTLQNLASSLCNVESKLHKRVKQYETMLQSIQVLSQPLVDNEGTAVSSDDIEEDGEGEGEDDDENDTKQQDGDADPDRRKSRGALEFSKCEEQEEEGEGEGGENLSAAGDGENCD